MVHCSEKIHGCLHEDSKIATPYGDIRISDLNTKQKIISYDIQKNKFVEDIVMKRFIDTSEDSWVQIELVNGYKLKCTASHKILTDKGFKPAIDLTEKDEIIIY